MASSTLYQPGDRIGGIYFVHKVLGGGMGEVYICHHSQYHTPYAIKTFRNDFLTNPKFREVFDREISVWVAMEKHANIVRCIFVETFNSRPFMFLELVAGDGEYGADLRGWLRRGRLAPQLAMDFAADLCRGLIHAGRKQPGLVHRDLKPENVLVTRERVAKITDFGLAKIVSDAALHVDGAGPDERQSLFGKGGVVGTAPYMAPEQWRAESDLDARTDIYAIGCILYELLTGRWPFQARGLEEFRDRHMNAAVPRLAGLAGGLEADLDRLLAGCLAKRREERFGSVGELLEEVSAVYLKHYGSRPREVQPGDELSPADYHHRGNSLFYLRRYEEALDSFSESIRLDGSGWGAYTDRGRTYQILRRYQEALADHNRAIELDPEAALAYSNRGSIYHLLGRYDEALADMARAIELNPEYSGTYANRANTYIKLGRLEEALASVNEALHLDPAFAFAYYTRGLLHTGESRFAEAEADFNRAIQLNPGFADAYLYRSYVRASLSRDEEAIADLGATIGLDPSLSTAYAERGSLHFKLKRFREALADLDTAIRLTPEELPAYAMRGRARTELGLFDAALADFDHVVENDPDPSGVLVDRGKLYARMGRIDDALSDYDKAIEQNPGVGMAYYNRGNTFYRLGRLDEALADLDHALELMPEYAQAHVTRGACYVALGRAGEAVAEFERAIELNPNLVEPYYNLGAVHANGGNLPAALSYFRRAAERGHPYAAQAAAALNG